MQHLFAFLICNSYLYFHKSSEQDPQLLIQNLKFCGTVKEITEGPRDVAHVCAASECLLVFWGELITHVLHMFLVDTTQHRVLNDTVVCFTLLKQASKVTFISLTVFFYNRSRKTEHKPTIISQRIAFERQLVARLHLALFNGGWYRGYMTLDLKLDYFVEIQFKKSN